MSGHVFHPGHEELHGVTVVVEGPEGAAWVGRYHERGPRGVVMHDVAIYDPATATLPRPVWLERLATFGVRVDAKHLIVPDASALKITRLLEFDSRSS